MRPFRHLLSVRSGVGCDSSEQRHRYETTFGPAVAVDGVEFGGGTCFVAYTSGASQMPSGRGTLALTALSELLRARMLRSKIKALWGVVGRKGQAPGFSVFPQTLWAGRPGWLRWVRPKKRGYLCQNSKLVLAAQIVRHRCRYDAGLPWMLG